MEDVVPPPNGWETPPTVDSAATTGVYAADRIPGTYLKTLTGVQRGEELFHRPDLGRPWRTSAAQRSASTLALKEKEIEELLRKCSSLRTQLGNAKHDAKYLEFAADERVKGKVAEMQKEVDRLETALKMVKEEKEELKTSTDHQLRLLKSQHEKELMHLQSEKRLLSDRCDELSRAYQQQVDDVKKAAARELEYVESLCKTRVEQLKNELQALQIQGLAAEERRAEDVARVNNLTNRIEADYKERLREAEKRVDEVRDRLEAANKRLTEERCAAVKEASRATEQLVVALADREAVLERLKQWNTYILRLLDQFYITFIESRPEQAVEPHDPELHESPTLYAPRSLMEDPNAKVTVERIVYRLLQLKLMHPVEREDRASMGGTPIEALEELANKQKRLSRAFQEIEAKCTETEQSLSGVISRLNFFSDDLNDAVTNSGQVAPPQKCAIFVCLCVFRGRQLWAEDAELARAAVSLMNSVLRPKMTQYGAYECYSDGASMLLAFPDPVAACRFCVESQWWLMSLPWPQSLLRSAWGKEEFDEANNVIYRGLRLSMAIHTGEVFVEPTAIPCGSSYRCHYYGRAVLQVIHVCSLAQGGQVIVTGPVWDMCSPALHELGPVGVRELGTTPIVFFNKETNSYEEEKFTLRQIIPQQLLGRPFQSLVGEEALDLTTFGKMRRSLLSDEIECVEARRASLKEAVGVANEELAAVDRAIHALLHRTRETKLYFHLFPPTEMVALMNNLYGVMEKVASRAADLRGDLRGMDQMQEELVAQTRGLKDYCFHHASTAARVEELQTHSELMQSYYNNQLAEMRRSHAEKTDQLQSELRERDQLIQCLYAKLQSIPHNSS
ncbi:hypothetical protein TraAM80_01549 [Trypanosoma rangeli]|uniref:Guanylate cyclase domain-containing protein n=1 Tax=Trypanosoma rangeli TaxID=5698 RepID=A0A422NYC2_TRYRA|nr:uncharacterized protein TraAM80_01549 [Trypanosoma rangeli]RNF10502.1 hypothetical protein TraAM80_01549 [Trypanosoma rangeli]|eukprot:RNF10502.1 hypothetical protein TraAM80_01549 [Trypanosoma rangeli]